ncbi:hypothetical protein SHIRM173S_09078 [Streptomyces hirsutus]
MPDGENERARQYRRIRTHLRDELGVDPGAALQNLELAILRGEELPGAALAPAERGGHGAAAGSRSGPVRQRPPGPRGRTPRRAPGCPVSPASPDAPVRPPTSLTT